MGGTLVVSRNETLYSYYKRRFEELGFENVTVTGLERDALNLLIDEMRPRLVIIGVGFYKSALSYMTGRLLRRHKGIYFAVVATETFPADIAMKCIINGVKSYVTLFDGVEQFFYGLKIVKEGKIYISPSVVERIEKRDELPPPSVEVTERELEVIRFVRNGFTGPEIAEELDISLQTVNFHKKELYKKFGSRNENELILDAEDAGYNIRGEKRFYPRRYELKPKIKKMGNGQWAMGNG